jgi:NAD(P)-dependent dehydrogenase (short-subunit alcohol dehydrogenase family)
MNKRQLTFLAGAGFGAWLARRKLRAIRALDLRGKLVLITGGSRGLGLELAREFSRQGARIAFCGRDEETLRRAEQQLTGQAADAKGYVCDVTNAQSVAEMVAQVERELGPVHVLVNNAGIIEVGPAKVMTEEDYREAIDTHFWGPLHATLAVLPSMRYRGSGRIVNITSIGGKISVPHLLPYSVSKFALVGFSEGLHAELAKEGIRVTTVVPGLMRTGSPRNAIFKGQNKKEYAWFSISDSLPLLSMDSQRAARKIVEACIYGDTELVLSLQAKMAVAFHGVFPGSTAEVLGLVDRLMPAPGGIGEQRARGRESFSAVSPSPLTALTERAARKNNEVA